MSLIIDFIVHFMQHSLEMVVDWSGSEVIVLQIILYLL